MTKRLTTTFDPTLKWVDAYMVMLVTSGVAAAAIGTSLLSVVSRVLVKHLRNLSLPPVVDAAYLGLIKDSTSVAERASTPCFSRHPIRKPSRMYHS